MATLNSQQYINIQCTTYKQIQYTIVEVPTTTLSQSDRRTRGAHKLNNLSQSIALSPNLESFKSGISTLTFEGFPTTFKYI